MILKNDNHFFEYKRDLTNKLVKFSDILILERKKCFFLGLMQSIDITSSDDSNIETSSELDKINKKLQKALINKDEAIFLYDRCLNNKYVAEFLFIKKIGEKYYSNISDFMKK